MTWTWTEIASRALIRSDWLGLGQIPTSDQQTTALKQLAQLLDRWDGQGLALPSFDSAVTFNTIASQPKYLLGGTSPTPANAIRPESIITATCTITTSPLVRNELVYMEYETYTIITTPTATTGQPWNYAINQTWPAMELYLYPTPNQVFPITLNCKIKWVDTVGDPSVNPFAVAAVPSGYADALISNLALEIARPWRLETPALIHEADVSRYMMAGMVYNQQRDAQRTAPIGIFPWNIGIAGRNP